MNVEYPSYPAYKLHPEFSIQFSIPSHNLVQRIFQHRQQDQIMRLKAAGNLLCTHIKSAARIMTCHRVQTRAISKNEMGITIFLPPPNTNIFTRVGRKLQLYLTKSNKRSAGAFVVPGHWVPLFNRLSTEKRHAVYIDERFSLIN